MSEPRTLYACSRCGDLSAREPTPVDVKEWQTVATVDGYIGVWQPTPHHLCGKCLRWVEGAR